MTTDSDTLAASRTARKTPAPGDLDLLRTRAFIGGEWRNADGGKTMAVTDPATGQVICTVPDMGAAETRTAIEAAAKAFERWHRTSTRERATLLRRWYELVIARKDQLAQIMTAENGKPLREAHAEIIYAANFLEWYAEEAKRIYGRIVPAQTTDRRVFVFKRPLGVTAAITPWNFPAAMVTREAAPALAAGCTIVLKPAEQTPLTALALAALAEEAGIPGGVVNVVTGDPVAIGQELTSHPLVRKLGFTGSNEVGKILMRQCAGTVKKVTLELGGNAPFIVFEDAHVPNAVANAMLAKFRNNGQTCVSVNRFLIHESLHDDFVAGLKAEVAKLKVGDGRDPETTQGPLIDKQGLRKVEDHVADAVAKGAKVVTGGQRHPAGPLFYAPTILAGVTTQMKLCHEETFGPVAPILTFSREEEAIDIANGTPFGLIAYFFTKDLTRAARVLERLDFGMVGVNSGILATDSSPMGGVKESGIGRVGGIEGIDEYLETQYAAISDVP